MGGYEVDGGIWFVFVEFVEVGVVGDVVVDFGC